MANGVKSVMVEFNRFGEAGETFQRGNAYIRTTADDRSACEIKLGLGYRDFVRALYKLRYKGAAVADVEAALEALAKEAEAMFSDLDLTDGEGTIQLDVVTSAAELWAFPFEAFGMDPDIVVTRRVRGAFGQHSEWPTSPRVLFVHAAAGDDLPSSLIEEHIAALSEALAPWTVGDDPIAVGRLTVAQVWSVADLKKVCETAYTHIHFLAHGIEVDALDGPPLKDWGMRIGAKGTPGVHPSEIAKVLASASPLPVVITIASCDSANQSDSAAASYSLAHLLHRAGVPVVVASQLPLTMHGSAVLTKAFYDPLLNGEDIREALHKARMALRSDPKAKHDWMSLVSYVRLPETYDAHLDRVALQMEIAMLRGAHKRMDIALRTNDEEALAEIEAVIRERIAALAERLPRIPTFDERLECKGLLASAYKRLAELLFLTKRNPDEQLSSLRTSLTHYRDAFQADLNLHGLGVQQLALQAALEGGFDPIDYAIVMRAARLSATSNTTDCWPFGTMAELLLLSTLTGTPYDDAAARDAVATFLQRAEGNEDAIDSTRRQLLRYTNWWIPDQFKTNLAAQAAALAAILK